DQLFARNAKTEHTIIELKKQQVNCSNSKFGEILNSDCNEAIKQNRINLEQKRDAGEDEEDNYAEINVLADHDYYYITNLNDYYYQQHQELQKQQQYTQTQLTQSCSSAPLCVATDGCVVGGGGGEYCNGILRKENGSLTHKQQQLQQQQHESLKGTLLRNKKKCRRKIVSLNFLMKNLIMYRLKYDIL
ncbi:PREDICTED: uncharacterized protein LOC108372083, partial [Rhagoletis zephyria]|uniref:uncharacterized protein LOC108372083 n=1 Tax=Rhagoletis zephyria TaxID=28612 RepID=UPI0008112D95